MLWLGKYFAPTMLFLGVDISSMLWLTIYTIIKLILLYYKIYYFKFKSKNEKCRQLIT